MTSLRDRGSFRDPSGFVFVRDGVAYRQVNAAAGDPYRQLMGSGLYEELARNRLLVPHEEVPLRLPEAPPALAVLKPEQIPFISYPYEWCFSALKAAALLTIDIQRRALKRGLVLRDASAYNIQFVGTRPIFIDTLSFGAYVEGQPWAAYRQFCQHFLAPLALVSLVDPSLGELSRTHIDGVPLPLGSRLLPITSRLRPGLLMHLHLHARSEARTSAPPRNGARAPRAAGMGRTAMLGLIDSLERTIRALDLAPAKTLWSTYATHLNYTEAAQAQKRRLVAQMIESASRGGLQSVWDLGANTGEYSRIAADRGARVMAFDGDHAVVEAHFRTASNHGDGLVLPLLQNLSNPSPAMGWAHAERRSLVERGPADLCLALALVHHLAIGGNVPLVRVAELFAGITRKLIIEFVPKEDSQVSRMLSLREDVFPDYTQQAFEQAFGEAFTIVQSTGIPDTMRTLYFMERR